MLRDVARHTTPDLLSAYTMLTHHVTLRIY